MPLKILQVIRTVLLLGFCFYAIKYWKWWDSTRTVFGGVYSRVNISRLLGRGYFSIQDVLHIFCDVEMVIRSRYNALVLSIANKVPILSVMKDRVGDKIYYYNKIEGGIQQVFDGLDIDEMRL